jgi:DNA-binding NarL/FixJ family response regulator
MPARILIVDDHEVVRMGIRMALKWDYPQAVFVEARDGLDALRKVLAESPDVVILDATIPGMNGFEAATQMRLIAPSVKIIFYSVHDIPTAARVSGGDAFVSKASSPRELTATVDRVLHA